MLLLLGTAIVSSSFAAYHRANCLLKTRSVRARRNHAIMYFAVVRCGMLRRLIARRRRRGTSNDIRTIRIYVMVARRPGLLTLVRRVNPMKPLASAATAADFLSLITLRLLQWSQYERRRGTTFSRNKKLSSHRETARCLVSLNISLSHSRSFEMAFLRKALIPISISI